MGRFEEADKLKARLVSFKSLDPSIESAIKEMFHIDWTYNSSAIEGNTYTREDTWYVYKEGRAAAGKTGDEFLEIRNHKKAVELVEECIKEGKEITIPLIKQLHSILLYGIDSPAGREAGRYKSEPNATPMPDGSFHEYVAPHLVPTEMEELLHWYSQQKDTLHPIELAAIFHWKFSRIHPFLNGNGRCARLLMNWILMGADFTPAIIKAERKQEYLGTIYTAHKDGNLAHLILLVEREVVESLTLALDIIEGRKVFGVEDLERKLKGFEDQMKSLAEGYEEIEGQLEAKRKKRIQEICDFIEAMAGRFMGESKRYILNFYRMQYSDVVSSINIFNYLPMDYVTGVDLRDPISEKIKNIPIITSCGLQTLQISLRGKEALKNYIPTPTGLTLLVFTSKYKTHIVTLVHAGNVQLEIDLLELGIDSEKIDENKTEEFFAKSVSCLIDMVEEEAEKRKRGESG